MGTKRPGRPFTLAGNVEDSTLIRKCNNAAVFQYAHVTDTTRDLGEHRRVVGDHITVELQPSDFSIDQRAQ